LLEERRQRLIVNSVAIVVAVNSSSTSWSNRFVALAVIAGVGTGLMFVGVMLTKPPLERGPLG